MFLPPLFLVHYFISGLRFDIKTAVLVHRPTYLEDAIGLAQLHEQWLALEKGLSHPSLGTGKPLLPTPKLQSQPQMSTSQTMPSQNLATLSSGTKVPFRRLSSSEVAQHRAQGLCYHCDEKYTWDHKCKSKP